MMTDAMPKFQPGDRVISFRGELATIKTSRQVWEPGKSHRVTVIWANELQNPDNTEYYEKVFEHYANS